MKTTPTTKSLLDIALRRQQVSLNEWFESKIREEAVALDLDAYHSAPQPAPLDAIALASDAAVMKELRGVDWAFSSDDTTYLSHDLHPYPAKFIPQIPRTLVGLLTQYGELVWDPFGGSGTTAVEALLARRRCVSSDANPLSEIVGRAKTTTLTKEDEELLEAFRDRIVVLAASGKTRARPRDLSVPDIPNLSQWFAETVTQELAELRLLIGELAETTRAIAINCFSKIIVRASFQDGETRYVRKSREVTPGTVFTMFAAELTTAVTKLKALSHLLQFRSATFATANVRTPLVDPTGLIAPESVSLVVTSPPYPNAYDYHLYHRFRLFWLGHDPREFARIEIGSHLRDQRQKSGIQLYTDEMSRALENMYRALQPGRLAVVVVGDAIYDTRVYDTASILAEAARALGFSVLGVIERPVHETKRSFIAAARRAKSEKLLVLRKPSRKLRIRFPVPPYRLWPFEARLRRDEISAVLNGNVKVARDGSATADVESFALPDLRRLTFTHHVGSSDGLGFRTWQGLLENGDAKVEAARKDPKYATHGLHPYKGKFYPQLAKALLNIAQVPQGATVLDPYCGSGTVLLESQLNGYQAVGFDVNPVAVLLARKLKRRFYTKTLSESITHWARSNGSLRGTRPPA